MIIFDCKLTWGVHISKAINKARKALFGLRLLKKYFVADEMRSLLDSYFYSVLYYNSSIWMTPTLTSDLKQSLLSVSANALRSCLPYQSFDVSFENIHKIAKKSTPKQLMHYQIALGLHKLVNANPEFLTFEQVMVVDQVVYTSRQLHFKVLRKFNNKIGMNTTANKLYYINDEISFDMLNHSFVHYKKLCKIQFLKFGKT